MKRINFCFIAVEPNWRHFNSKIYKKLNHVFCFGLQKMKSNFEKKNLSFESYTKKDQGASLFKKSDNPNLLDSIIVFDTDYFCENILSVILDSYNDDKSPKMILRLNCEGTEDDVIYSIKKKFPNNLLGILGSLDDVEKKRGEIKSKQLNEYLISNSIDFCRFSSNMSTWPDALKFLEKKYN